MNALINTGKIFGGILAFLYLAMSFPMSYVFIHIDGKTPLAVSILLVPGLIFWLWAMFVELNREW